MKWNHGSQVIAGIFLGSVWMLFCSGCAPSAAFGSAEDGIHAVLSGETSLLYAAEGEEERRVELSEIPAIFSPDSDYAAIWRFAVVDLDGDGEAEAVLQVIDAAGDMGGYMVLHWQNGKIYGYTASYRDFEDLKTDGTYFYSNPATMDSGACRAYFEGGRYCTDPFIRSYRRDSRETVTYFIEGRPVSEEEYGAAMRQQAAKQTADWHAFSRENIRDVFA